MKTSKSNKKSSKPTAAEIKNARRREAARIKKSNAEFAKLTPAQRRVVIAQDVLAQMSSGQIVAEEGVWANFKNAIPNKPELELQDFLNEQKSCNVCGLGSLFVCAVKRFNNLKISKVIEGKNEDVCNNDVQGTCRKQITVTTTLSYLKGFFSENQLQTIEAAFEQGNGWFDHHDAANASIVGGEYFSDLSNQLSDIGEDLLTAELKMKLIMQNIIKNKGTFKTDKVNKPVLKTTGNITIPGF